jgi:predicted PurR-regulated permease PerM
MSAPHPSAKHPASHTPVTRTQWGAFVLAAGLLLLILQLHLLLALLSALATYSLYQALVAWFSRRMGLRLAEGFTLAVVLLCTAAFVWFVYAGVSELHEAYRSGKIDHLLASVLGTLHHLDSWLPVWVQEKLPQTPAEAQQLLLDWSDAHPDSLKTAGQWTGRAAAHLLIGIGIGFLAGASPLPAPQGLSAFTLAWRARLQQLYGAFVDVVSAQLRISVVNTVLTALFLLVLLPLLGYHMPLAFALVVITLVAGLLPIVGNLISNTAITLVALTISPWLAVAALLFLIGVHKLEYFINAKIMGHKLRVRTYELLAVMLIMESVFGIGGLVAAPVYYAWLTRELRDLRIF